MAQVFKAKTLVSNTGIFSYQVSAPNLVYNTGNQIISGVKTFAENTTFGDSAQGDFLVISGNQFTIYGSGNFTSGLFVNGNAVLTGIDLSSYATKTNLALTGSTLVTNLASTGSTLDTKINTLSGIAVLKFGDQTISGVKTFANNIQVSGTGVFNAVDFNNIDIISLSGVDISIINGNVNLTNRPTVNGTGVLLSGEAASLPMTIVYTTGNQNIGGNKTFTGITTFSGQQINLIDTALNLSGVGDMTFDSTNINFINSPVFISGTNLRVVGDVIGNNLVYNTGNQIISGIKTFDVFPIVSGNKLITGVDLSSYAAITNLANTGSILDNKIGSLSGNLTSTYATITNLANTGSTLVGSITSLSGLFTGYTGSLDNTYATDLQLYNTGSTLDLKINSLSGVSVLTFGNQNISGTKTFIGDHIISGNTTISGSINISGNYDIYSQIENAKKLAIAYAIAL